MKLRSFTLKMVFLAAIPVTAVVLFGLGSSQLHAQSSSEPEMSGVVTTLAPPHAETLFANTSEIRSRLDWVPTAGAGSTSPVGSESPSVGVTEGALFRREEPRASTSGFRRAATLTTGFGLKIYNSTFFSTTRPSVPAMDQVLLGSVAAVRIEDAVTTPMLFKNGAQEDILPDWVASSHAAMLSLGMFATSAQYRLSKFLIDHGHTRIARITELAHALSVGYYATQNIPAHHIYIVR